MEDSDYSAGGDSDEEMMSIGDASEQHDEDDEDDFSFDPGAEVIVSSKKARLCGETRQRCMGQTTPACE